MAELLHSKWGASKFEADIICPGKHVLEAGLPNSTSKFAAEGTVAHQVLTWALQESRPAAAYIGVEVAADGYAFEVDAEMAEHVQVTIDYVLTLAGDDGVVLVDQKVNYSSYLDVPKDDAWGTLDVAVLRGTTITAIDLKYGMGVEVSAGCTQDEVVEDNIVEVSKPNPQLSLYALGILEAVQGLLGDFETVRLAISQPRISKTPSEYDLTVAELEVWAKDVAAKAVRKGKTAEINPHFAPEGWAASYLNPTEKSCKFCRAKATCPALRNAVMETTASADVAHPDEFADFEPITPDNTADADWLAACLSKVDLIEDWCKAVRAEVERRLLAGLDVPQFKLVAGKRGNRQWADPKVVEETLKSMRLKECEMYDFKLISPATADKLAKAGTIGPRQWPKLQDLITQSNGKPHVAPDSDPRPALVVTPVLDDFSDVTAEDLA